MSVISSLTRFRTVFKWFLFGKFSYILIQTLFHYLYNANENVEKEIVIDHGHATLSNDKQNAYNTRNDTEKGAATSPTPYPNATWWASQPGQQDTYVSVDEDADLDSNVTHYNKTKTDTAVELLGKQCRKRSPWVTTMIIGPCD